MFYGTKKRDRKAFLYINLTEIQKQSLKGMSEALGISLSLLLTLVIRYFIYGTLNGVLTLDELLRAYQKLQRIRNYKKTCKITLRIEGKEFQEFSNLANQWLYLPGELAGILAELLTVGIIDIDSIWNVQKVIIREA